ncbi:MAG: tetratricopeptide repeat protein, partial [Spirochaetia bacterium]
MEEPHTHLKDIGFITIPDNLATGVKEFTLAPDIKLPVELGPDKLSWNTANITWEAIIAGILRVLIADPAYEHASYYRKLVITLKPNIKHDFTEAGIIKAKNKDFPVAIEIFEALHALFPGCAVSAYKHALQCDPELAEIYYNMGYFFLRQESFKKAKEQFSRYLELETDKEKRRHVEKIIGDLESLLQTDNLFKEAFDNISMGNEQQGIEKITALLEKNPDFWNGWFLLGWGYRRLGRFPEAKSAFLKALEKTKPNPDLLNELAITCMELGDLDQSEQYLKQALKQEPHNTKVISNLGVVALRNGDHELAEGYFKTVLE